MRFVLALVFFGLALFAQQQPPQDPSPSGDQHQEPEHLRSPETIEAGKGLFVNVCSGCHGPNGEGGRGPSLIPGPNARRLTPEQLFEVSKNGLPGSDMPPLPLPEEQLWQIAAFVRSLSAPASEQHVPGNAEKGKALFFGKADCQKCHMIRGQGGFLGPDLSNAGAARNLHQLREALLEPNQRITEGFTPVTVTAKDGKQFSGVAKNNSNYSMQLLEADGSLRLLMKQDLDQVVFRQRSWMPADLGERLTAEEIQNLLAFMSRQAVRAPQAETNNEE